MKESFLYESLEKKKVKCNTCNHYCVISDGKIGICGVRSNIDGKLYVLSYGKVIANAIDPIEKKPIYHFLPKSRTYSFAAVGCNMNCPWCQNWQISQGIKTNSTDYGFDLTPEENIKLALKHKCNSISYTYTEPTVFLEYAYDTMLLAKENNLKNIWITNGYMSNETLDLILSLVDAMNIDLKVFDNQTSIKFCGARSDLIMKNIKRVYDFGTHIELTTLIVPEVNDSLIQIKEIAYFIATELSVEVPWHINRFYPVYKMQDSNPTDIDFLHTAKLIGKEYGLKNIHLGNI